VRLARVPGTSGLEEHTYRGFGLKSSPEVLWKVPNSVANDRNPTKTQYDTRADARALEGKREKQAFYYNRQAHDLPPL